jgi:predicted RNA-binding Zn ribbon-like protein
MSRLGPREPVEISLTPLRPVSDLLWVVNTRHGPGGHWFARVTDDAGDHDHLASGPMAVAYLDDHHVVVPSDQINARQLKSLAAIRDMVRGLLDPVASWTPTAREILGATRFRADASGRLAADGSGWNAFIGDLMLPLLEVVRLRDRLRICGNPYCRLVFLDLSKNRSRRWCDDGGCGNRDRVRRYRSRLTHQEFEGDERNLRGAQRERPGQSPEA